MDSLGSILTHGLGGVDSAVCSKPKLVCSISTVTHVSSQYEWTVLLSIPVLTDNLIRNQTLLIFFLLKVSPDMWTRGLANTVTLSWQQYRGVSPDQADNTIVSSQYITLPLLYMVMSSLTK